MSAASLSVMTSSAHVHTRPSRKTARSTRSAVGCADDDLDVEPRERLGCEPVRLVVDAQVPVEPQVGGARAPHDVARARARGHLQRALEPDLEAGERLAVVEVRRRQDDVLVREA